MKHTFLLLITSLFFNVVVAQNQSYNLEQLDVELQNKQKYLLEKENRIDNFKNKLSVSNSLNGQYNICLNIFEEYKSFQFDSAFQFLIELHNIASKLDNNTKLNDIKIKQGFILSSSGMFKEAFDSLISINSNTINDSLKPYYFEVMAILYYGLSDFNDKHYKPIYENNANTYIDSFLVFTDSSSLKHQYYRGLKHIRSGKFDKGEEVLQALRERKNLSLHEIAVINSTMSDIYINKGENNKAIELLIEASICDIKSATKETAAILNLANLLFNQGDIKRAYTYTKQALDDANYYGARHRKIQVGRILPIVEEEKINTVERQKKALLRYLIAAILLSITILIFIFITLRQVKKLKKAENIISKKNKELLKTNQTIVEANKIKDKYIGYYFSNNSTYIDKIESLKNSIEQNLEHKKLDNIRYIVNKINLKKERASLYQEFDRAFLSLFPNFINDFNTLFEEKDKIQPEGNGLLNTHLRIFALIRLGITENDKIAKILEFSVNTIYAYKTKIKNKSIVPNDEFDKHIMKIRFS